ncbi:hypothetical protein mru_0060 [Methanobrevibacter ruminantium M1]|uniref:Uncharacterized protein n=1 Tax=Methanobrevibacter ruminantium (strain ATCC 35063 / DSM 1093 / JCM 13430 / OCM 146 / M1) TaxID=634498 RepID=D3E4L6_METRM|nr:hypothetical protein [Methanobrevibacter ruminantium]ADC45912.1 hypothetical protein mru_0060 [Methanobrevibacter ruminantium M1]
MFFADFLRFLSYGFLEELKQSNCYNFLDYYNFAIGSKVFEEINQHLDNNLINKLHFCPNNNYNYSALIAPLLSNEEKNKNKGEYEVIGLSLHYLSLNQVKYIIIDDKRARKFAKRNFEELQEYITGTIGIIIFCSKDNFISKIDAANILKDIEFAIENHDETQGNFICSLGKQNYKKIIDDAIKMLDVE